MRLNGIKFDRVRSRIKTIKQRQPNNATQAGAANETCLDFNFSLYM